MRRRWRRRWWRSGGSRSWPSLREPRAALATAERTFRLASLGSSRKVRWALVTVSRRHGRALPDRKKTWRKPSRLVSLPGRHRRYRGNRDRQPGQDRGALHAARKGAATSSGLIRAVSQLKNAVLCLVAVRTRHPPSDKPLGAKSKSAEEQPFGRGPTLCGECRFGPWRKGPNMALISDPTAFETRLAALPLPPTSSARPCSPPARHPTGC